MTCNRYGINCYDLTKYKIYLFTYLDLNCIINHYHLSWYWHNYITLNPDLFKFFIIKVYFSDCSNSKIFKYYLEYKIFLFIPTNYVLHLIL